ncbi:MAG TPA: HupE/UreJ family protein [Pseudomonadota bacterium]|nr:HupE/UreJ family protein [Pseudomonadota bacterium]
MYAILRPCAATHRSTALLLGLGALLAGLVAPRCAAAHQSSVVYSDIAVAGRQVELTLQVTSNDLYQALGLAKERPVTLQEARDGAARLGAYFMAQVTVENHGHPCPGEADEPDFLDKGGSFFFIQRLHYRCLRSLEEAEITYNLMFDIDPRHQGLAHVRAFGSESEHVFRSQSRTLRLGHPLGVLDNVRDYLQLGIEHIFTGYDHLAFLFGLLIIAAAVGASPTGGPSAPAAPGGMRRGLGYVVRIVTAFTIAHSVTLVASALGWVALPSRLVESFIAVSIGYVAVENILRPEPRHRFLLTFSFGLMHGFGFASVLKEVGLPKAGLLWSLLSFNLGVELGQLAVVVLGFPVLFLLARHSPAASPQAAQTTRRAAPARRGPPFQTLELVLLAVLLGLCVLLFVRFSLPLLTVCLVALGLPAALLFLVPRYGYDRCVRIGTSAILLGLSLLWFFERVSERTLLGGWLG